MTPERAALVARLDFHGGVDPWCVAASAEMRAMDGEIAELMAAKEWLYSEMEKMSADDQKEIAESNRDREFIFERLNDATARIAELEAENAALHDRLQTEGAP